MKPKLLLFALAAVLIAAGLWLSRDTLRDKETLRGTSASVDVNVAAGTTAGTTNPTATQRPALQPPNPNRRFIEFTPEQRVEFSRKGHGPGG
ncbi:MAG TPA: hypothetical protein VEH27_08665 [Methylomirabilota bacterium]|nr:hypothetical protein [Methylomirabilota bacterium]